MRIGVLSHTRVPTRPVGSDGLGRLAWEFADGLAKLGHRVNLGAGPGSEAPDGVALNIDEDEDVRAETVAGGWATSCDIFLDLTHHHTASRLNPDMPIVNYVGDLELTTLPARAVVAHAWHQRRLGGGRIVPIGVDVDAIPFHPQADLPWYLAYCAKIHPLKGFDLALAAHERQAIPVQFAGERFDATPLPNYRGVIEDNGALWAFLGGARALLSPSRHDAGGRVNLESAACGTPVLCLDGTGTAEHVAHCVSGYHCADVDELVEAVADVGYLDRAAARAWVRETHDIGRMMGGVERLLVAAADGETW
jgi:glycosyltransferase involved in cell wall biosynthesis